MPFANLGFGEIVGLMVIGLLVFGSKRLPEIGSSMGKGIREFKKSLSDMQQEISTPVSESRIAPPGVEARRAESDERSPEPKRLM